MCADCCAPNRPQGLSRRHAIALGGGAAVALLAGSGGRRTQAAPPAPVAVAPGLTVRPRATWAGELAPTAPMAGEDVRFLLVHHSASSNVYAPDDVPGILRGVFRFHTGPEKRWPDVAYNFFVDAFGGVWEGRAGSLEGAVAADATGGSQGFAQLVCLVGDFTDRMPTAAALDALNRTLAWLGARHDIDTSPGASVAFESRGSNRWPAGERVTTATIAGHRDMSATACPGETFYPHLRERTPHDVTLLRLAAATATTATTANSAPSSTAGTATTAPTTSPADITVDPRTNAIIEQFREESGALEVGSDEGDHSHLVRNVLLAGAGVAVAAGGAVLWRRSAPPAPERDA